MIASLGWYPATRPCWERLWTGIRDRLGHGPDALTWPDDWDAHWHDPDLLLAMTCSLPLRLGLVAHVHVVGAPVWDLPGLPPGTYASHLVARAGDDRPLPALAAEGLAVNALESQSGWGALADAGIDGPALVTGSHARSMAAVAEGRSALAAIDVVTWAMAPHAGLTIRATTPPSPATPFVTARADLVPALREAIAGAIAAMPPADRAATRLGGIARMPPDAYAAAPPVAPGHCIPGPDAAHSSEPRSDRTRP